MPLAHGLCEMRAPVQRNDTSLAVPIVFDHHESRTLHDVGIIVVGAGKNRRPPKGEATDAQPQILRTVELLTAAAPFRVGGTPWPPSGLCLWRQGGNSAVWRIHDE